MPVNDSLRVRHIPDSAREAVALCRDRSRAELDNDRLLALGLTRLLEIIGEAARGVSPAFREKHPQIPWKEMAGMRDRLIHGYFDVNLNVVWQTVTTNLPSLIEKLERIVPSMDVPPDR